VVAHSAKTAYALVPQFSLPGALTIRFIDALLVSCTGFDFGPLKIDPGIASAPLVSNQWIADTQR
jgi:hypothetical protein